MQLLLGSEGEAGVSSKEWRRATDEEWVMGRNQGRRSRTRSSARLCPSDGCNLSSLNSTLPTTYLSGLSELLRRRAFSSLVYCFCFGSSKRKLRRSDFNGGKTAIPTERRALSTIVHRVREPDSFLPLSFSCLDSYPYCKGLTLRASTSVYVKIQNTGNHFSITNDAEHGTSLLPPALS